MLIIDGNSVYEIDCDCARRQGLYLNRLNQDGEGKREIVHADTGRRCIEKPVYTGEGVTVAVLDTGFRVIILL